MSNSGLAPNGSCTDRYPIEASRVADRKTNYLVRFSVCFRCLCPVRERATRTNFPLTDANLLKRVASKIGSC